MDGINKTVLQKIYSDDVIFHYTKAASAIDYILYHKKLKFSQRKESNDPIENEIFRFKKISTAADATIENEKRITENYPRANEIYNSLKDRAHSYQQICFCCNTLKKPLFSNFSQQAEEFGFTKPRMWEQYGDNYEGVCIAFSKKKILKTNNEKIIIEDNIRYKTYSELNEKNKIIDILKAADENYEKQLEAIQDKELFLKHQDYSGENEYRINILNEKNNHNDNFLDIDGCIVAIIISQKANNRQQEALMEYANIIKVPHFNIEWKDNGINLINAEFYAKKHKDLIKKIKEVKNKNIQ